MKDSRFTLSGEDHDPYSCEHLTLAYARITWPNVLESSRIVSACQAENSLRQGNCAVT